MGSRTFCYKVKPILTSKVDINGNIVEDKQKLTKEFKHFYINRVKATSA